MKKYILVFLLPMVLLSCKKENRLASRIEGIWEVDRQVINDVEIIKANLPKAFSFEKCKPSKGSCEGKMVSSNYAESEFAWIISEDGKELSMTIPTYPGVYSILSLKRKKLEIEGDINGNKVYMLMSK